MMRTTFSIITMVLLLLRAGGADAQQNTPPPEPDQSAGTALLPGAGQVDFGFRGTAYGDDSDEARYQRYRDLRSGAFVEGFRWGKTNDQMLWNVRATHVGYRDQQYSANYNRFGKVKASFEFNQIPLFFNQVTRTPYAATSDGVLGGLGSAPAQIQSGTATSAIYENTAAPFDMRLQRSITDFRLTYSATEHLDLNASFKKTDKSGEQPWAGTFGFSNAVELAVPVDTTTTDVGVAAEWTGERGQARVGYDGSFFSNDISSLVWGNPLRSTDSPSSGPAQGRMSIWPDSTLNSGSISGLYRLPRGSIASGYVSLGSLSQDDALIPFTINTQVASPALDRASAEASAQIIATAFSYTARPTSKLWLNARFRSYDFDNETPVFHVTNTVSYDTKLAPYDHGGTSPFDFTRKLFDLDTSWSIFSFAALRAGYSYEGVEQTFRTFDTTNDNKLRLSADSTSLQWLTLRAQYEYSHRTGTGLDEQSLDDNGEQTSLRQFDLSNRDQNRFSAIVIATMSSMSLNGSWFIGRDTRPDSGFGLLENDSDGFSLGADYVPAEKVSLGASYQYKKKYSTLQKSRQADPGPQFDDPTRDWTTAAGDSAHTFMASADLLKLWPRTDLRFSYDLVHAETSYIYGLTADTTLPPVEQLPNIFNTRNRLTADARYMIKPHVGLGLAYWFEKFSVDDYAFNPSTLDTVAEPSFLSLEATYRPYTANTFWARLTVLW